MPKKRMGRRQIKKMVEGEKRGQFNQRRKNQPRPNKGRSKKKKG